LFQRRFDVTQQTSSLARYQAALRGQVLDRVPVIPVLHVAATELVGATIGDYSASPQTMADTVIAAYRHYGLDGVQLSLGVATEASAFDVGIVQSEDSLPKVTQPAVRERADLDALKVPDPQRDGLMPRFLEALGIVMETIGDKACIMAVIRGPLNVASQIRGIQPLMYDLVDAPDFAAELLAFSNQVGLSLGQAVAEAGAHVIVIGEALCSPHFISPAYYRRFVQPLHRELCQALGSYDSAATLLHICGDIRPILEDIAVTEVEIVDIDWQVSIAEARAALGPAVVLRGNVDPVATLHDGTPEAVTEAARTALEQAEPAGRFILGSGCDIPPGTPRENIAALVSAARREQG
jgi:uroporphyrinogen decarboxylase